MRQLPILFLLFISSFSLYSQNEIASDSLLVKLKYASDDSVKVATLLELSLSYRINDLSKSLDYAGEALELAKESDDSFLIANSLYRKGTIHLLMGDYNTALNDLLNSLRIFEDLKSNKYLFPLNYNLGGLYDRLENYDNALEYYFKALSIYNTSVSQGEKIETGKIYGLYNNIGNIYQNRKETSTALQYYRKGLEAAIVQNDYVEIGVISNNLGKLLLELKQYEEALESLQKSLQAREKINDKMGMAKSYYFLGAYYMAVGENDKALEVVQKSLVLGKEVASLPIQNTAYQFLYEIYENKREFEKSLEAFKWYKITGDSLLNEKTIRELTQAKMQYEYDKKEKIREAEQQKKELKYSLIISVLTLGFIITGLLYSLSKSRTKRIQLEKKQINLEKKNLEQDLEVKNKELTTNVMYLLKKNEFMNDISSRLVKLKSRLKGRDSEIVQNLIFDMQSAVDDDVWADFEMRFEQVHNDFFRKLKEICPDLTPSNLKICAFLRLNMTTKEISSITNLSIKTIETARTRIRKKLNLTKTDVNLVTYLNEF